MENWINQIIEGDCLELMREMPDKSVDLVLTDPPYGIGISKNPFGQKHEKMDWDSYPFSLKQFKEIQRVSKNQVIWGGNYFPFLWDGPCKDFLFWNKFNKHPNRSAGELAWTSFNGLAKYFEYVWDGNIYGKPGNIKGIGQKTTRIHPTEKPVPLFQWVLSNYSKPDDLILDPFSGSGSLAVACHRLRRRFICIEKEPKYVELSKERLEQERAQMVLF